MSCLYILEINALSVDSFANIFSHSEGCLFVLFMVSFAGKIALGGIQVTMPLMDLAVALSLGIGAGCGVIVGQYFGEHDNEHLSKSSHTAMAISIWGGLGASVIGDRKSVV